MSKKKSPIPSPTSWIEVVPGADPVPNVLMNLLIEEDANTVAVKIGFWHDELGVFTDMDGQLVEATEGPVTRYHILTVDNNVIRVR